MSCSVSSYASDLCSAPPPKDYTLPFTKTQYPEETRLRYTCINGYLRKAGTSSLIECKWNGTSFLWNNVKGPISLICIRKETATKRPETPSTLYTSQQTQHTLPGLEGQSTTLDHKTTFNITTMTWAATTEKPTTTEKATPTEDFTASTVSVTNGTTSVSPSTASSPKWIGSTMKTTPTQSPMPKTTPATPTQDNDPKTATSSLNKQPSTTATTTTEHERLNAEEAKYVAGTSGTVIILGFLVTGLLLLIRRRRRATNLTFSLAEIEPINLTPLSSL
ncbi:interleukin-15 receptor subunit alpha isoform X1 [Arapaima gigas]